jgi:hypothetical protein
MIYPGEGKKGQPKAGDYVLAAEQTRAEAAASPHRSTAVDLARADKWDHIHQQVNVTEGGQAVVAGETVTRNQGERRRGMIAK